MATIQLLHQFNGYKPGFYDFGAVENARLIALGLARDWTVESDGGQSFDDMLTAGEVVATRALVSGGVIYCNLLETNSAAENTALLQAAITEAEGAGETKGGQTVELPAGDFDVSAVQIGNGYAAIGSGYRGGVKIRGRGILATRLHFAGDTGIQYIASDDYSPLGGALYGMELSDMAMIGPGVATAGAICVKAISENATKRVLLNSSTFQRLFITGWETCFALEDSGENSFCDIKMVDFTRGFWLGYNCDKLLFDSCNFGNNTLSSAAGDDDRAGTAVEYGLRTAYHPSGAQGNNLHSFVNCHFCNLLLPFKFTDIGIGVVKVSSYFEACKQIATFGANDGVVNGPKAVNFDGSHFSRLYQSAETAPKFQFLSASNTVSLIIQGCQSDATDGPNGGWIDVGASFGGQVVWDNNELPHAGSATNQWHLYRGGKAIVIPNGDRYVLRGGSRGSHTIQYNANANANVPAFGIYGWNADASTLLQTWGFKASGTDSAAGGASLSVVNLQDGGNRYAALSGANKVWQGSGAPPTAASTFRGVAYLVQGGAGVADAFKVCVKDAADSYSWKTATLT